MCLARGFGLYSLRSGSRGVQGRESDCRLSGV